MAGMRDMLLWMKTQQQKPEFAAAKRWLDRNQTPIDTEPTKTEEAQVVDEAPSDKD